MKFKDRIYLLSKKFSEISNKKKENFLKEKFLNLFGSYIDPDFLKKINNNNSKENLYNNSTNNDFKYSDNKLKFKIEIYMKDYFTFDKIKHVYNKIAPNLSHENDGIILNLDDYPYYSGESTEIFKWKPRELNSCDFEIDFKRFHKIDIDKITGKDNLIYENIILLKVHERKNNSHDVNILIFSNKEEEEEFLMECRSIKNTCSRIVIECYFDFNKSVLKENLYKYEIMRKNEYKILQDIYTESKYSNSHRMGHWKFMRFRKDKLFGNSLKTFFKVWESIEDNLTIDVIQNKIENR
jgi:hypothetical protein